MVRVRWSCPGGDILLHSPCPGSKVNHLPCPGQRSTTPCPGSKVSHSPPCLGSKVNHPCPGSKVNPLPSLPRVKGQPPPSPHTSTMVYARVCGTHPTGMHSSFLNFYLMSGDIKLGDKMLHNLKFPQSFLLNTLVNNFELIAFSIMNCILSNLTILCRLG